LEVQKPRLALNAIDEFLKQKDSMLQKKSNQLLSNIKKEWNNSYFKADSILLKWDKDAAENHTIFLNNRSKWLSESKNKSDSLKVEWALKNARTVKQFVETKLGGNYEGRDKAMAENVEWILNQRGPEAKVVLWAHDSHISRGDSKDVDSNFFSGKSMGSYLSKEYKSDYCALGLFTYQGTCLGTISYSNFNLVAFDIYTSPVGSLDEGLHQVANKMKEDYLIMNLKPFKNDSVKFKWMTIKRPVRYVGYVAEDYGFGGRYSMPYQFDGIIFINQSTRSTKINSK
jgi:erythromycin esterase